MDITETPAQREVRERYTAWLDDFLPDDYLARYHEHRLDWAFRRAHQRDAFEAGWLVPQWEPGLGGQGLDHLETLTIRLESARRAAPKLPNIQGVGVVAPGLREHGTPEQIDRYLVPLLRGDEWWALGMSEPGAGSDFGSIRTRAVRHGDTWVVNGQKIWTTQADQSRYATLYCRTDPAAPKHRGITCFIADLTAPGVTIRRIRSSEDSLESFCEVFFDDVELRADAVLGAVDDGWNVAMSSLDHERDMIWIMNWVEIERGLAHVRSSMLEHRRDDLLVDLGRRLADAEAIRMTGYRAVTNELRGERSPEFLILKLFGSESLQQVWELAIQAAGPGAVTDPGLLLEDFDALAATLYGGTSEVQRNIIGERALGLPKG
ncbi:MAG: acyl-CoA dehydrogenase [Acidimicrobiales bacterium]|nr:acyl-CoA dehydrogenase [Acidimicrobiales bacterium]